MLAMVAKASPKRTKKALAKASPKKTKKVVEKASPKKAKTAPGKGLKVPEKADKRTGLPWWDSGHRHFEEMSVEEARELREIEYFGVLKMPVQPPNPLDLPENQWATAKIKENAELTKTIIARGLAEQGPPSHIRSEDITDFQEPILRKAPTEPTVAAEPFPTNPFYRPPRGTNMLADLADPSLRTTGIVPHKMELVGADEDF